MRAMNNLMGCFLASLVMAGLVGTTASAGYVTTLGVENQFLNPAGWNGGDPNSTYQEWDYLATASGNSPDHGYVTNPTGLDTPTFSVKSPGFVSGSHNFYSFSADYGATADIYNHGGSSGTGSFGSESGTHVIVQVGTSVNSDEESFPGHGTGVYLDSLKLVNLLGGAITGGDNGSALQIAEVSYQLDVPASFGAVDYQELIYEFWLPGYTGDFRVDWDQKVHAMIDTLRVDSMIAAAAVGGGSPFSLTIVPEPGTVGLLVTGAMSAVGAVLLRRRRAR